MKKLTHKRLIKLYNFTIQCYFYNYFKSPGLKSYPDNLWINKDYNLMKKKIIQPQIIKKIANNLFNIGNKFNLFLNLDYFIMMPQKSNSINNLKLIIIELINIIKQKNNYNILFINNIFHIDNYRKFWKNKFSISERQKEIKNKIYLLPEYINFFDNKKIIIIDDVISSGVSVIQIISEIINYNNNCKIKILCYGSVYKWYQIYK